MIKCKECKAWVQNIILHKQKKGECRFHAPEIGRQSGEGIWPRTFEHDGCLQGERGVFCVRCNREILEGETCYGRPEGIICFKCFASSAPPPPTPKANSDAESRIE